MRKKHADRMKEIKAANAAIVMTGKCPNCGSPLRRNLAITGWWQCEQFGDGHFRARPNDPKCSFQAFV